RRLIARAFRAFPLFSDWHAEVFTDFVECCFRESPSGKDLTLACPREVEARIFGQSDLKSYRVYGGIQTESHLILPRPYYVCPPGTARRVIRNNPASSLQL